MANRRVSWVGRIARRVVTRHRAIFGPLAIALLVGGCESIVGIEEGKLGYCSDDNGATNPFDDDGNPCTVDKCVGSATDHVSVADGTKCSLGENVGTCSAGKCRLECEGNPASCKCASDAECPLDEPCVKWACAMGQCERTIEPDDTLLDTQEEHDCKKRVCVSGAPQTVNDDLDAPSDTPGDCQAFVCDNGNAVMGPDDNDKPAVDECVVYSCLNGMVVPSKAATGTPCSVGACTSAGGCNECLVMNDWNACGGVACPVKMCNGELCASDNSRCMSGFCADTVCCNEACSETCESCNLAGSMGVCTNIPYYQEDPSYGAALKCDVAVSGSVCDGNGSCLKIVGTPCTQGAQCISNTCTSMKCLGAPGEVCSGSTDCVSGMCAMGACK